MTDVISEIELFLHLLMAVFGIISVILLAYIFYLIKHNRFKKIMFFYLLSFVFFLPRAIGGSLARLHLPISQTLIFNTIWTFSGIVAFAFAIYASILLYSWLKETSFEGVR